MSVTKHLSLRFTPRAWQQECMNNFTRFTVLALHRRAGKTWLALATLCSHALANKGCYGFVSPQKNQAKMIAWGVLKELFGEIIEYQIAHKRTMTTPIISFNEQDLRAILSNGSEIRLMGADDPDKIRGNQFSGIVLDEVAQMPREMWQDVVRPALMDNLGWGIFIGTPKGINLFSDLFFRGVNSNHSDGWSARKYTCYETDALRPDEIEAYKNEVDSNTFRREMLCDFDASADNQLLTIESVVAAMKRAVTTRMLNPKIPLVMGVDVARYGNDRSVVMFRRGDVAEEPIFLFKSSVPELAEFVTYHFNLRQPKAVFVDGTGVGGGVADILLQWGLPVYDINFSSKSTDKRYGNKRSEMWGKMATWVNQSGVLPKNDELMQELCAPVYSSDEGGKITLESKDKMKERLGASPDFADALALTFAQEIAMPQSRRLAKWGTETMSIDDDIFYVPRKLSGIERYIQSMRKGKPYAYHY